VLPSYAAKVICQMDSPMPREGHRSIPAGRAESFRKEVIQPQVPLRLPCYDLVPITSFALDAVLLAVRRAALGAPRFRGLTGGVYKAQEHIHRRIADRRLLAIPASCRRVAACNPNWGTLFGICLASRLSVPLYAPL
jgi:hypothetical protein